MRLLKIPFHLLRWILFLIQGFNKKVFMKYILTYFLSVIFLAFIFPAKSQTKAGINVWITNPDKSALFAHQDAELIFSSSQNNYPVINVNEKQTYQSIDGFGFALTGGSA